VLDAKACEHQRQHDADRGEIIAVGENAHAGRQHGAEMEALERFFVEKPEAGRGGHRAPQSLAGASLLREGRDRSFEMR
jgi:hypothetical protein